MKYVYIPFEAGDGQFTMGDVDRGIRMSVWCRQQGLVKGQDYDWCYMQERQVHQFVFYDSAEMYASLFSLVWINNNEFYK